jgi:CBS domain-containing protein
MKISRILDDKGTFVATVSPDDTVLTLCETLNQYKIGAVVVSADGSSVDGIASERDVIRNLAENGPSILEGPVSSIMTEAVACAELDNNTDDLMLTMTERRIRHVPVLQDDALAGIVSIGDVVRVTVAQLQDEKATLLGYITS